MKLNTVIYKALRLILVINARLYGRGASREVCRDLAGEFKCY